MILHLTSRQAWDAARAEGDYRAPSLDEVGFIHCSTLEQLLPVANAFYRDMPEPVVLWIEADLLAAPLRWEAADLSDPHAGEQFPHVYGPINLDAVSQVTELARDEDGVYRVV